MTHAIVPTPALTPIQTAFFGYIARYTGSTRRLYERHLNDYFQWCADRGVDPMTAGRTHLELYVHHRTEDLDNKPSSVHTAFTPVKGFYRFAVIDGLVDRDPAVYVRLPKVHVNPVRKQALDRNELARMIMVAQEISVRHWALIELLAVLGLRISEALAVTSDQFAHLDGGYRVLRFVGKGGRPTNIPLPQPVLRALEQAADASHCDHVVTDATGTRPITRGAGAGLVDVVARRAGITRHVNPHLLRASLITQAFDSGLSVRDVQHLARHDDPRTTSRHYDLGRDNLDRHAVHVLAARLAA